MCALLVGGHQRQTTTLSLLLVALLCFSQYHHITASSSETESDVVDNDVDFVALPPYLDRPCRLIYGPSRVPGVGRGVIAGKDYVVDDDLDISVNIPIAIDDANKMQIRYYIFGSDQDNYSMLTLGLGQLLNSIPNKNTQHYWWETTDIPVEELQHLPYTGFARTVVRPIEPIKAGEEIFNYYGESWFEDHGFGKEKEGMAPSDVWPTELDGEAICMTDVEVAPSSIPDAGLGLFATRSFRQGELVTIAPMAAMTREQVDATWDNSVLKNYCFADSRSQLVLLPMTTAAVMNHGGSAASNVEIRWFDWRRGHRTAADEAAPSPLEQSPWEVMAYTYAPVDFGYYALRDIALGEELLVDYGARWEQAWTQWRSSCDAGEQELEVGQGGEGVGGGRVGGVFSGCNSKFREYIEAPEGLYPPAWL